MKKYLLTAGLFLFSVAIFAEDDFREFTNHQGDKIQAYIIDVTGDQVKIKRQDGQIMLADIALFSNPDQNYIKKWQLDQTLNSERIWGITARRFRGNVAKTAQGPITIEDAQAGYKITVQNRSNLDLEGLDIQYKIFMWKDAHTAKKRNDGQRLRHSGSREIPLLKKKARYEFVTDLVTLRSTKLGSGWYYKGGSEKKSKDKIKGIWIQIHKDGKKVYEYANPSNLIKKEQW